MNKTPIQTSSERRRTGAFLLCWLAVAAPAGTARAEVVLETPDGAVRLEHGHLQVLHGGAVAAEVKSIEFDFKAPLSLEVAARAAGHATLHAVYPAIAKWRDPKGGLPVDIEVDAVAGGFRFHASPEWALSVTVRLQDMDDHYFGVLEHLYPNNRRSPDLRGNVVDVEARGEDAEYDENYASVWSAFYMTTRGYASFFDTFARGRYTLGINGETELYHRTGKLDWYVFFGRDGDEILSEYYKVIGAPKAPPLWAMGPIGWRDENKNAAEIVDDIRHMTDMHIPFTAWWVDRPYSNGTNDWSKMDFSARFAHPKEWIGQIERDYDLKFMTWIGPMTFGDPDFPGLFPGDRGYLDLSDPAAVKEFERRLDLQYAAGVRGHKMDRAEEYFPEMAPWKDGTGPNEARNKYLFLYAKVTSDILTRAWGDDHCNFPRGAIHRAQPYLTAVWGGDVRASWDGLGSNLANAMRCGFMGFPVWGSDCGGYLGTQIDDELYARWVEFGAWSGLYEIKLDNYPARPPDRPPWIRGEQLQAAFREACEQRMQLLPYVYSLARTSARHGVLMKPLAYVWPDDPATYAVADEYLFGPAFLVAPLTEPGGQRSVYLPAGKWRDYYNPAQTFAGGRTIDVTEPFDRIPVFVRANSIFVTGVTPLIGNEKNWLKSAAPLVIHAAPGEAGESASFEFVDAQDQNRSKTVELTRTADAVVLKVPALSAPVTVELYADAAPQAKLNGRDVAMAYAAAAHAARVSLPAGTAVDLEVRPAAAP
ncbi:MAG TPA: TIM-barrel domain-containing protein [Opitutaceae bacterium]|nr:TIM-barrel domain-containing protein [Opitutaceae bacterium]